jgi:biotin carboxylase
VTRTLLFVSGGVEAVPGIRRAKALGFRVVVVDRDPHAPAMHLADDRIVASTYDEEAVVAGARAWMRPRGRRLDGVIAVAADVPRTVAAVAETFGLRGPTPETARLATDKLAMKERFRDAGVPIPWFAALSSAAQLRAVVAERGLPLVVKPVDSRGARGVLRVAAATDLDWAFAEARRASPTGRVMVEEYLEGPQFSTESLLVDGRGYTPGFAERNYEYLDRFAPHMIENGGQQPPAIAPSDRAAVIALAEEAGRALGVRSGPVKGDMVLTPSGPRVIEVAARLSGGWFCTDQIPLATGVDLVGAAIRLAAGDPVRPDELAPTRQRGVAIRYFFPPPGRVTRIDPGPNAGKPWVHRLGFFVKPGDILEPPTNHTRRAGYVITEGATCAEAVARAEQVVAGARIATVEEAA